MSILDKSVFRILVEIFELKKETQSLRPALWILCVNEIDIPKPGTAPWVNHEARVPLQVVQADPDSLTMARAVKTINSK